MTQTTLTGDPETTVVNVRTHGRYGVRIVDRSTEFGNPFRLKEDGGEYTREESVGAFREWFYAPERDGLRQQADRELAGKTLGYWCVPEACHAEVMATYLNQSGDD